MSEDQFLDKVHSDHHRALLWLALELTKESSLPVLELGAGYGSTKYLRQYCKGTGREFMSWDNDEEWAEKWGSEVIKDWTNPMMYGKYSVVLVDQSPGEHRKESMSILKEDALILVVHDAEPESENSYKLYEVLPKFKYVVYTRGEKVWTVAVSNHINLNDYVGRIIKNQKIEL